MAQSVIVDINEALAEESDYEVIGTIVGPDGVTPVEPAAIQSILATLRDLELGTFIFEDEIVTSAALAGGEFLMDLTNDHTISTIAKRYQRRLLTLKMTQTNGKQRKIAIRFVIENLTDAP